jgi:hypothetical protein
MTLLNKVILASSPEMIDQNAPGFNGCSDNNRGNWDMIVLGREFCQLVVYTSRNIYFPDNETNAFLQQTDSRCVGKRNYQRRGTL